MATKRSKNEVASINDDLSELRQRSKRYRPLLTNLSTTSKQFKRVRYTFLQCSLTLCSRAHSMHVCCTGYRQGRTVFERIPATPVTQGKRLPDRKPKIATIAGRRIDAGPSVELCDRQPMRKSNIRWSLGMRRRRRDAFATFLFTHSGPNRVLRWIFLLLPCGAIARFKGIAYSHSLPSQSNRPSQ
jgi:hypothetical protein